MLRLFLLLSVFYVNNAFAEEGLMPIDITAESLELQQRKGYAVFNVDVKVIHGQMRLGAQKLEVFYGAKEEDSAIQKIVAEGKVTLIYGEDTATGDKAVYSPDEGKISVTGDVVMIRDGNILKGNSLTYDTKTRQMKLGSEVEKKGRVKATFSIKGVGLNE